MSRREHRSARGHRERWEQVVRRKRSRRERRKDHGELGKRRQAKPESDAARLVEARLEALITHQTMPGIRGQRGKHRIEEQSLGFMC